MGVKTISTVQLGQEVTPNTAVPATAIMAGITQARHRLQQKVVQPPELRGIQTFRHRTVVVGRQGEIHLEGCALFDDINYFLGMAMRAGVVGTSDSGVPTPAYTRDFVPAMLSPDLAQHYSLECGDNTQYWRYRGCVARNLEIGATVDDLTKVTADLIAVDRIAVTKTPALAQRTPEDVIANRWKLYIDLAGGTLGTTLYGGTLMNWRYRFGAFEPFKGMDGTLERTSVVQQPIDSIFEGEVTLDPSYVLQDVNFRAGQRLLCRLENTGQVAIHTTVFRRIRIDFAAVWMDLGELGANDTQNQQTVRVQLSAENDPTAALIHKVTTVNSLATLP